MNMSWNMHSDNSLLSYFVPNAMNMNYVENYVENGVSKVPMIQKPTPRIEVDLNQTKHKGGKSDYKT